MRQALAGFERSTLPIMPATARELRTRLASRNSNNQDLQQTLLRDPAATIALYRRVEQSRPGAARDITDPAHALSMIGREPFARMVHNLPEVSGKRIDNRLFPGFAYSQSAHAAWYAQALGKAVSLGGSNESSAAALLQNPAVLALWHKDHESAARATNAVRDGVPFDVAFAAELGEPLEQANKRLARAWHFPQLAREVMGDWDPFNRLAQSVRLADMMAQTSAAGWPDAETSLQAEILEEFLGVSHDAAASWWRQTATEAARQLAALDYPLPGYELAMLPEEESDIEVPELPRWNTQTESAKKPDPQQILAGMMRRVQNETGIERAVFGMLNRDRSEIRARMALGGDKQDPVRKFRIPTASKSLFSLLVSKQQSIWLNPGNRAKYTPLLHDIPQDATSAKGFYAMSIFARNKPIGLLYVDGGELSEQGYKRFRQLCAEVAKLLDGG